MAQNIKISLGGQLLHEVLAAAALDEISTSEVVRRILWGHFEGRGRAEAGPSGNPGRSPEREAAPEPGPNSALDGPGAAHRSPSLPRPLPSPPSRDSTEETKAEAKAPSSGDSLDARCSGGAREATASARPGGEGGPAPATLDLGPAPPPSPDPPPVLRLPCRATRRGDVSSWALSVDQVERWRVAFPGLDVIGEARKAEAWLRANPGRWKTPRGIARFLFSWLERASDGGRAGRRGATAGGAGSGWSAAADRPAPPPKGSIREAYGRDSFEAWEAELRAGIDEPDELEKCLRDLARLRGRWEAGHAA